MTQHHPCASLSPAPTELSHSELRGRSTELNAPDTARPNASILPPAAIRDLHPVRMALAEPRHRCQHEFCTRALYLFGALFHSIQNDTDRRSSFQVRQQ